MYPPFNFLSTQRTCRICNSEKITQIGKKISKFSQHSFDFLLCNSCSFRFVDPILSPEQVYNEDYYQGKGADPFIDYEEEFHNPDTSLRVLEFNDLFNVTENYFKKKDYHLLLEAQNNQLKWLDYGCGAGGMLQYLKKKNVIQAGDQIYKLDTFGFDQSPYIEKLRRNGFQILDTDAINRFPDQSFEVISCLEVIEHIPDPKRTLSQISRLLKPGGLLLLTTGNLNCLLARLMGFKFPYCIPEIHISLFNPKLLAGLYESVGLQPLYINYKGAIHYKILKTLGPRFNKSYLFRKLMGLKSIIWLADLLFGTSKMPIAIKIN